MIVSAEIKDTASYVYFTQDDSDKKGKYFVVDILRKGEYSFQVSQTPHRVYPNGTN